MPKDIQRIKRNKNKMDYKIVFSDIDGTLLDKNRGLAPATIEQIKKLKNKIPFILISARMPAAMRHLQQELEIEDLPIICYNGGLVLVNGKVISSTEIPIHIIEDLTNFNSITDCHLSLYHNDEWYVPRFDEWAAREKNNTKVEPEIKSNPKVVEKWKKERKGAHKIMAMGPEKQIDDIRDFLNKEYPNQLNMYRSKDTYLEIAHKSMSKLTAIELLLDKHFSYSLQESVAFGDNYNDVEMLENVGLGIAVGNAREEAKLVAALVTHHHKEDGVAKMLDEIFNKNKSSL